jgi:large subunit ribosomal protein L32e
MNDTEKTRLLRVRKRIDKKRPDFLAFESWRYKRIRPRWRKPTGIDNKMRTNEKGWPKSANVGWGGPLAVRGLHPSGKEEVTVHNVADLSKVNSETQVARISGKVGKRKRDLILEEADKRGIKVLNRGSEKISSDFDKLEDKEK